MARFKEGDKVEVVHLAPYEQAQEEVDRLLARDREAPSLEGKLRILSAFFRYAAEEEHAKRPGVWHLIAQARQLAQMLYEDRPVA